MSTLIVGTLFSLMIWDLLYITEFAPLSIASDMNLWQSCVWPGIAINKSPSVTSLLSIDTLLIGKSKPLNVYYR